MREDNCSSVVLQGSLHNDPGVNGSAIDGAGEHPLEADHLMLVVQEQHGKVLVLFLC